jgi:hypothetical protein
MPAQHRKTLAKELGGDPGSADANHFGRLAGFTNRKEKYFKNNLYPFVYCREATGKHVENYQKIRDWVAAKTLLNKNIETNIENINVENNPKTKSKLVFKKYFEQYEKKVYKENKNLDISTGDFAVVCRMIKEGYDRNHIFNDFKLNSRNLLTRKGRYIDDYINRTIDAAAVRCKMKPET